MFKFDLKKAVLYTSVGVGCIAVLFAATVAPLGKILPGGHIGASEGAGNAGTEQTENEAVETAAEVNWGLSFQQAGQPPVGNATPEYLAKYNAYYIAGSNGKEDDSKSAKPVYLTFDAGYENGYTEKILDILKEKKVPAAFFLVGNYIEENPELVKRMEAEGHIVGNHTMHHPDMSAIADEEAFKSEIKELEDTYREAVGKEIPKFYRPPQGKYSEANLQQASRLGYTTLFWSLAYVDWLENDQPDETESINLLNRRIHPGAIVLLHSTSKTNSRILGQLIDGWKAQGYEFRSVSELGTGKV